jgi:hypothetical protein
MSPGYKRTRDRPLQLPSKASENTKENCTRTDPDGGHHQTDLDADRDHAAKVGKGGGE